MVAKTQFQPQNPYALFSPDQWLNQFSTFNNAALPWPSSYSGMPTDAMGKPIQPPPRDYPWRNIISRRILS